MKKTNLLLFILLSVNLSAQEYFQQETNYTIDVTLDDEAHTLKGNEHIQYTNNSPNDLDFLWFHIWPNAYKDNSTALFKQALEDGSRKEFYSSEAERGFINGLDFKVNGQRVRWDYHPEHIDICKLILNKPLKSGESIQISTPFFVKIPDAKFSRLGHVGQSYMITQWYPKPAVYDNEGWHPMPYLNQGEFYSEFGSFDVSITLPSNYTVAATGDLQNNGELARLNEIAKTTDTITKFSDDMSFPLSDLSTKTLRYTQSNVHDFGWFADKRFHVLKGEVEVPHTKEKVTLWTMFTNNEADLWKNSIEYMHDAVYYYSLWNGDYPYKQCSAVDGTIAAGGGMEYPNVTVIGASGNAKALEEVIMHEVGHNWFYGMLGSNERDHPWMDEGLNSHNEMRYMRKKYPDYNAVTGSLPKFIKKTLDLEDYTNKQIYGEMMYFMNAWTGKDQPIELHSADYIPMNYGGIVYSKTAIVFDYLMAYLGEDVYDKCMRTYFKKWQYKHPQPKDVKAVFEEVTGKDLAWFFEDVITTIKQLDYAIVGIKKETKDLLITLENKGEINGPVIISGVKDGQSMTPLWIEGFKNEKTIRYFNGDYDHIRIDYNGDMPETNRNNNSIKTKGLFRTCEPLKLQVLGSFYHPEKTQIFFLPMYKWNMYDKSSFGIMLYNRFVPKEGFSYKLTPMYSTAAENHVSGSANLGYEKYNQSALISRYKLGIRADQYLHTSTEQYRRFEPSLELDLRKENLRSKKQSSIHTSFVHLDKGDEMLQFAKANYTFSNKRTISPYSMHLKTEFGKEFTKANLIINYNHHINNKKRLHLRGYAGVVQTDNSAYNLQMSAWNGLNDYMFANKSLGRNETDGLYNQQLFMAEGGLKHHTNITSGKWLSTLSAEYNLTNRFRLYAEAGSNGTDVAYGAGLYIPLLQNIVDIYLPIYTEEGMVDFDNYQDIFRFNINFDFKLYLF
jgi:hypothetical protein